MQEVNSASTNWIAAVHAHGALAPVAMLIPKLAGATLGAVFAGAGAGLTLDGLVPKVLCPRKWLVPTMGLQSLALPWAHRCRAGTGSHAGTEGGVPEEMAGANPGPAIAGAGPGPTFAGLAPVAMLVPKVLGSTE